MCGIRIAGRMLRGVGALTRTVERARRRKGHDAEDTRLALVFLKYVTDLVCLGQLHAQKHSHNRQASISRVRQYPLST